MSGDRCERDVYERGTAIGYTDQRQKEAEALLLALRDAATGAKIDWHYIAGRAVFKALGTYREVADARLHFDDITDRLGVRKCLI